MSRPEIEKNEKRLLTLEEANVLVQKTRYRVTEKNRRLSRCVDGRNKGETALRPLAKPGGDLGDYFVALTTLREAGITVTNRVRGLVLKALIRIVGGAGQFHWHGDKKRGENGCSHCLRAGQENDVYKTDKDDAPFAFRFLDEQKIEPVLLDGEHQEGGVIVIAGKKSSIQSQIMHKKELIQSFVYQVGLDDERRMEVAEALSVLFKNVLPAKFNKKKLYKALTKVNKLHLTSTLERLADGLPIFVVSGDEKGGKSFLIEQKGNVRKKGVGIDCSLF